MNSQSKIKKMLNLFNKADSQIALERISKLSDEVKPQWGKMTASQMLAHLNVAYDMAYTEKYPKATGVKKFLLKMFVKNVVVGPKPYPKNGKTAPAFIISGQRNFEDEKSKLIDYINKTQELGETHFHNKESNSFGPLPKDEWNVLFSKHLDHHLRQFGV